MILATFVDLLIFELRSYKRDWYKYVHNSYLVCIPKQNMKLHITFICCKTLSTEHGVF